MFLTLLCASIFDSDFLTDSGEESDVIHASFKPFTDESWRVRDASMTKDDFEHTATTIKIPRNTPIEKAVMTTVTIVTEDAYTFGALKCNAEGAQVQDAVCYGDATDGKEPFRWGITPNVGETEHVQFYMVLRNGTLKLSVYLYNNNKDEDVTFLLPEFWIYHKQYSKLPASRTELVSGHTRVWRKTGHVTQEMGKIKLYSAALPNAHAFPSSIGDGNLPYSSSAGYYGIVPVTANATHIVGFDIYHDSFMQPWSHNTIVDDNGETGRTLELSMMARNESGADITYLVMEVDTVSWLDAVEKWHSEFPDVYHKTQGWGLWATFANLQKMFPNSTEDIDLFHVGFQWGSSYSGMKPYIPNHIYSEPTLIHLDIPYNQETLMNDMNKCEYDPSLSKTDAEKAALKEKCKVVLDSALRDKNLNLVCREEDAPWNVGLCCNVIYEGKAREYFYRQFKNSIEAYLKQGAPRNMTGGAFDSFSAGQTVTYVDESNPRPGDGYLPYFLLDPDQKPFVCLHAAMFEGFKDYMVYSPQGMLMNTFYVPPEMVLNYKYGYEVDWWSLGVLMYEMIGQVNPFDCGSRLETYRCIVRCEPEFDPACFTPDAIELISGLLRKNPRRRYGFDEIKASAFFQGMDWDDVYHKRIKPPYLPPSEEIAENFDVEFTKEAPVDSAAQSASYDFQNFSYMASPFEDEEALAQNPLVSGFT